MNPFSDPKKTEMLNLILLAKASTACRSSKTAAIRSYPKYTCAAAKSKRLDDIIALSHRLCKSGEALPISSLYHLDGYYLCLKVRTAKVLRLLPTLCEHSQKVYLGKSYAEAVREHAKVIIEKSAIEILSS